jgi:hypothetical protein
MENPQTLTEYNDELETGDTEIDLGNFITAEELKLLALKW